MSNFETYPAGTGKRIEQLVAICKELEAKMKWADEISNIQDARIDELEAKIYKAVVSLAHAEEQLVLAAHAPEYVDLNEFVDLIGRINSTIATLKGQDDDTDR